MISGIILASGLSRRMKTEKLLLPVNGVPLAERVIRAAAASCLDELILVYRSRLIRALARGYTVTAVYNRQAASGQSAAVKRGVRAAHPAANGYMFLVADQPCLNARVINRLADVFSRGSHDIVVPVFGDLPGTPVIFSAALRSELLKLQGDAGGRTLIRQMPGRVRTVRFSQGRAGADIDTPEDYRCFSAKDR